MKKFLLFSALSLGVAVSASGALPDMYLRGAELAPKWGASETYKFTHTEDGAYTLTLPKLTGEFKISNTDWTLNLGAEDANHATITKAVTKKGVTNGPNFRCSNLTDVTIRFTLKMEGDKLADTHIAFDIAGETAPPYVNINGMQPSGSLPVLYISTEDNEPITSKETYLRGNYYLDPMGVTDVEAIGSAESPLPLQIRGRGNFTWQAFAKKPYRLKLDKKAALLGMNSSKHFALLAHADDNRAFMRNLTGFEVSRMSGLPWTPADKPCEVVLNGNYIGLYFLTETIRFDKKRINLTDPDDVVEDWLAENPDKTAADYLWTEEDYTGPWLIEFDNNVDEFQVIVNSKQGQPLRVTHKTPEDYVTDKHRDWLINEITAIDNELYTNTKAGKWLDRIDLTDAARFFVTNQIMNNYESYSGSCYLTKDKGADAKWHFSPVWDFGSAFQVSRDQTLWIFDSQYPQHWCKPMWENPTFKAEVKRIFEAMDAEGFDRIFNYQNEYAARIKAAAAQDAERWKQEGYGNADMATPLAEVQKQLRESINSFGYKLGVAGYTEPHQEESDLYLRGEITGWNCTEKYKFTKTGTDTYELIVRNLSGQFKIGDKNWLKDFGASNTDALDINRTYPVLEQGGNFHLNDEPADVMLTLDAQNKQLTISDLSGVAVIDADNSNSAQYFNLQGARVAVPAAGQIYIRVKGSKAEKVIF
ncbi:MAG: CotH kinase family protein [Muribaculaceae bacterium]|nr:CotH kinase family protein [Muribaculaceae bacterium]